MDLADQKGAAWTAWEIGKQWGHSFLVLPVVAGELFYLSENGQARERALAALALERAIAAWKFTPRDLSDAEAEIVRLGAKNHRAVCPTHRRITGTAPDSRHQGSHRRVKISKG